MHVQNTIPVPTQGTSKRPPGQPRAREPGGPAARRGRRVKSDMFQTNMMFVDFQMDGHGHVNHTIPAGFCFSI